MRTRVRQTLIFTCSLLCIAARPVCAQEGAVTAIVSGMVLKDLIDQVENAAKNMAIVARNQGDALLANAASAASVSAANAAHALGSEMGRRVADLKPAHQQMLQQIWDVSHTVNNIGATAEELERALDLDVHGILSNLGGEKLYINRIFGITQIPQSGSYVIGVDGVGVGARSADREPSLGLRIEGKDVPALINPSTGTSSTFVIPNSALAQYIDEEQVRIISASLSVHLRYQSGWWIWKSWKDTQLDVPFYLTLLPKRAGVFKATAYFPTYTWSKPVRSISKELVTGNHECTDNCRGEPTRTGYSLTLQVEPKNERGDLQRLSGVRVTCVEGSCEFSSPATIAYRDNDRTAEGTFSVWSKPTKWRATGPVEEQIESVDSVVHTYRAAWNAVFDVHVPQSSTLVKIEGVLTGNATVFMSPDEAGSSSLFTLPGSQRTAPVFTVVNRGLAAKERIYSLRINAPPSSRYGGGAAVGGIP